MKQEIISKQSKVSSFYCGKKTNKERILGVYQKEKVICDRRMEIEIDVWEMRKLERSEDVGNCVNWLGSGNIGKCGYMPYEDCVMNNSKGK